MRTAAPFVLSLAASVGVLVVQPAAGAEACARRVPSLDVQLPAPIAVTTRCGQFLLARDGRVRLASSQRPPVPAGVSWWPSSGVWERLDRDSHLVVGRWQRRLWRSRGRFPVAYAMGAITVGPGALAFSYGNKTPQLYLARLGGRERRIASGEFPIGWATGSGFYTRRGHGGELLLRSSSGTLRRVLSRQAFTYAYGQASGGLYFLARGWLVRAHGASERRLSSLAELGFAPGRSPQLEPLGRLIALRSVLLLAVVRDDGSLFATVRTPPRRARADGISSPITASSAARAVAFTATRGNTAYGSRGSETVYLLRPESKGAMPAYSQPVRFAICERGAQLACHGRWLLYSASEGELVAIDTSARHPVIDLSTLVRRLPGSGGGEGHLNFSAGWADQPAVT